MFTRQTPWPALLLGLFLALTGSLSWAGPVNINTADAATMARELKGIGEKRAQAIIEYRQKHGPFKTADELALVKGIGASVIAKNREFIRIGDVKQVPMSAQKPPASASPTRQVR